MSRRWAQLLAGALVLVAGVAVAWALIVDDRVVRPPSPHGGYKKDLSDRPVETTLHKYDRHHRNRYMTTGESITFRFPASAYDNGHNEMGGPQWLIALQLDRRDLTPILPKIRDASWPPITEEKTQQRLDLERHRMLLSVQSSLSSSGGAITTRKIERGELRHVGEYCGLSMYVDATKRGQSERAFQLREEQTRRKLGPVPYPFSEADTFLSHERTKGDYIDNDFVLNMKCALSQITRTCSATAYFERWPVRLHILKDRICGWRDELARIQDFLAAHVVRRTPKLAYKTQ